MTAKLSIMLAALVLYSGQGWAASWQQAWSARVSTEYDTNPTMSPTNPGGIWRALLEPGYKLKRTGGANELNAGAALLIARTSNKTLSQDRNDPSVFLDGRRQSDAGEFGLSAKYDEVATRIAEIDNAGPFIADGTRVSRTISGSWSKALSERSTLWADGSYQGVSYKGGPYVNYANQTAGLKLSHAWSEGSMSYLRVSNVKYVPAGGGPSSSLANATLGWNWKVADDLEGTLQTGKSRSSAAQMSTQGMAEVKYTGQRTWFVLNANRQVTPSGLGGFVTADQAKVSWSYALSERSNTGIDLGWGKSHFTTDIINRTAGAWLQHELNSFWVVRTNYLHKISEQDGVGRASSNILGIALVYTHTDF